jgi:hypothetical protein
MGEVIRVQFSGGSGALPATGSIAGAALPSSAPPRIVHQDRGWRILRVPRLGHYLALSARCRGGVMVGGFDPREEGEEDASCGSRRRSNEIAILTDDCAFDEDLARCAVSWLNGSGPQRALLGSFIVATQERYLYWKDAVLEVAAIGGLRLIRLVDGGIAAAREPSPVILLNPFARSPAARYTSAFVRLPPETRRAVLHWTDPRRQLAPLLEP